MTDLISVVAENDTFVQTLDLQPALNGVRVYAPGELPLPPLLSGGTEIEVTTERTHEAVRRLCRQDQRAHVCALNFASAKHPGGGYRRGSKAQEEDLCRVSTLYYVLKDQAIYYDANHACGSSLYTDTAIYTPKIEFFRASDYSLIQPTYKAAIITTPAPKCVDGDLDPSEVFEAIVRRIDRILAIAFEHNHRNLVLGAWGCGVFKNNPYDVSKAFFRAINACPGAFRHIVFAIGGVGENFQVFEHVFNGR